MTYALRVSHRLVGWFEIMAVMPLGLKFYECRGGALGSEFVFRDPVDRQKAIDAARKAFESQMHAFELPGDHLSERLQAAD